MSADVSEADEGRSAEIGSQVSDFRHFHRVAANGTRRIANDGRPGSHMALVETEPQTISSIDDLVGSGSRQKSWIRRYQATLVVSDLIGVSVATTAALLIRFGSLNGHSLGVDLLAAVLGPLFWLTVVAVNRGYEGRFIGAGSEEFRRIFLSFLTLTALVSFVSFATHAELARGFVLLALPLTLALNVWGRYAARKWLHRQRAQGRFMTSVLLVGDAIAVADFAELIRRDRHAGLQVVGGCVPSEFVDDPITVAALKAGEIDLLGDVDSVLSAVRASGANTVAVVSSHTIGPEKLRWISWQLEGSATDLVVAPGLIEVAGTRLHIRPMAGLPLLHVEEPEFTGFRRVCKGAFDRSVAAMALFLMMPLIVSIAIAVRLSSRGPAFFRPGRVGRDGRTFTMLKFRSMYTDAEQRLAELSQQNDHGDEVLFKMRHDPRITRVGSYLRKFSLDELPQLLNVVGGSMSLVGPRPPLPAEVERYEDHVHRKFLVKPGLTGLWQISGRSDLAWEESVRLDLRYVENWSIPGDLLILWKTVFAVLGGSGAY